MKALSFYLTITNCNFSPFDAGFARPGHDVFTEGDEEDEKGDDREDGGRHLPREHRHPVAGFVLNSQNPGADDDGDDLVILVGNCATRPNIGIPRADEGKNRDRDKRRARQGRHDFPKKLPVAFSVDFRREVELFRDLLEVLPKEIDVEGGGDEGENHDEQGLPIGLVLADEMHVGHRGVIRDREQFPGNHHGGQEEKEQDIAPSKTKPREGERSENGGQQLKDGRGNRNDQRRPHVLHEL